MSNFTTPNFRGWRAIIVHRQSETVDRLVRQLSRLGISSEQVWPRLEQVADADVIFFDGDNGYDGVFPWPGEKLPVPMIALLGSEAPGRLEWALQQGVSAHLLKPIGSGGVFSTLVIAVANFTKQQMLVHEIADLENRARLRPMVIRSVLAVMQRHGLNEDAAYGHIRSEAMRRRQSIEALCETGFFTIGDNNPPSDPKRRSKRTGSK